MSKFLYKREILAVLLVTTILLAPSAGRNSEQSPLQLLKSLAASRDASHIGLEPSIINAPRFQNNGLTHPPGFPYGLRTIWKDFPGRMKSRIQGTKENRTGKGDTSFGEGTTPSYVSSKVAAKNKNEAEMKIIPVKLAKEEPDGVDGGIILTFVLSIEGSLIFVGLVVLWCVAAYYARYRKGFLDNFKTGYKRGDDEADICMELFEYSTNRNSKPVQVIRQEQKKRKS